MSISSDKDSKLVCPLTFVLKKKKKLKTCMQNHFLVTPFPIFFSFFTKKDTQVHIIKMLKCTCITTISIYIYYYQEIDHVCESKPNLLSYTSSIADNFQKPYITSFNYGLKTISLSVSVNLERIHAPIQNVNETAKLYKMT